MSETSYAGSTFNPSGQDAIKARHLLLLPRNLACLAKLSSEHTKYSTNGVRVTSTEDGYRCDVTDGRVAAIVRGSVDDESEYPNIPALAAAPNSGVSALVPADAWVAAFKAIPKRIAKPILGNLAIVIGQEEVNYGTTNLEKASTGSARLLEGRFPAIDGVFEDNASNGHVIVSCNVDPDSLVNLLTCAKQFSGDDMSLVTLQFRGAGKAMLVTSQHPGQKFDGAIQTLSGHEDKRHNLMSTLTPELVMHLQAMKDTTAADYLEHVEAVDKLLAIIDPPGHVITQIAPIIPEPDEDYDLEEDDDDFEDDDEDDEDFEEDGDFEEDVITQPDLDTLPACDTFAAEPTFQAECSW